MEYHIEYYLGRGDIWARLASFRFMIDRDTFFDVLKEKDKYITIRKSKQKEEK